MDDENVLSENAGAARQNDITLTIIHSQPKKQRTTLRPAEWLQTSATAEQIHFLPPEWNYILGNNSALWCC